MCMFVRISTRQVFFYSQKSKFVSGNLGTNSEDFQACHHRLYTLCHLHDLFVMLEANHATAIARSIIPFRRICTIHKCKACLLYPKFYAVVWQFCVCLPVYEHCAISYNVLQYQNVLSTTPLILFVVVLFFLLSFDMFLWSRFAHFFFLCTYTHISTVSQTMK